MELMRLALQLSTPYRFRYRRAEAHARDMKRAATRARPGNAPKPAAASPTPLLRASYIMRMRFRVLIAIVYFLLQAQNTSYIPSWLSLANNGTTYNYVYICTSKNSIHQHLYKRTHVLIQFDKTTKRLH